jgi:hypothetical protein
MAGMLTAIPGSAASNDCLPCQNLRQLLTQCGTCGSQLPTVPPSASSPNAPSTGLPGTVNPYQPGCPPGTVGSQAGCINPATGQITPQQGAPPPCPAGTAPPCQPGYETNSSGCCVPIPVEVCFTCPGGDPELQAALQGQPNSCSMISHAYIPSELGGSSLMAAP